jgi:hypothetical protein
MGVGPLISTTNWRDIAGRPYLTVSSKGTAQTGITNNGADYGPDTSGTTTCGIQEAITGLPGSGGIVFLDSDDGSYFGQYSAVTGQISVPSNVCLMSGMFGGEAYGVVVKVPPSYIKYTGSTSQDALVFPDQSAKNAMIGVAIVGVTTKALVHRIGTRMNVIRDCFIQNTGSGSSAGYGEQIDGSGGHNAEDNQMEDSYVEGQLAAIQIGTTSESQHSNDSTWFNVTAENPSGGTVINHVNGGNHQFVNFYSRGGGSPTFSTVGNLQIYGGEMLTSGGVMFQISGGTNTCIANMTMSAGNIKVTNGQVTFRQVYANTGTGTISISGGGAKVYVEDSCDFGHASFSISAGELHLPRDRIRWDPQTNLTQTGGSVFPELAAFSTNPPVSGTTYRNEDSTSTLYVDCTFNPTSTADATLAASIGPTSSPSTQFTVKLAAGTHIGQDLIVPVHLPPYWYYKLTTTNATLNSSNRVRWG